MEEKIIDVVDFSALPSSNDGNTILYKNGQLYQSTSSIGEIVNDKVGSATSGVATESWVLEQNYITNATDNLTNYYKKSETYSQEDINSMIGAIGSFEVVSLTTDDPPHPDVAEPSTKVIYLTKDSESQATDPYTEWIWLSATSAFDVIGETTVDLSDYQPVTAMTAYYTKTETSAASAISDALSLKEDKVFVAVASVDGYVGTEYQNIKNAYDAGKQIILKLTAHDSSDIQYANLVDYNEEYGFFSFSVLSNATATKTYYCINNDGWSMNNASLQTSLVAGTDININTSNGVISVNTNDCSAIGSYSFVEGYHTTARGDNSHAEGYGTSAAGNNSHAEGYETTAAGTYAHTEGIRTYAGEGSPTHAEGYYTSALGSYSHSEGQNTYVNGSNAHGEGYYTSAMADATHTEGYQTVANSQAAHAEGYYTSAIYNNTHAEGQYTYANRYAAHAEGYAASANNDYSHAEGQSTYANGIASHAEGEFTSADGNYSHAEGSYTTAIGDASHAEGVITYADAGSHVEGYKTIASGEYSHAEGIGTIASASGMHAGGTYNATTSALYVIGNGQNENNRSDAFIVDWNGTASATKLATSGIADIETAITNIATINTNGVFIGDRKILPGTKLFVEGMPVNNVDYSLVKEYNAFIYNNISAVAVDGTITLGLWNYDTKTYVEEETISTDSQNPTVITVSSTDASDTMEIHLKGTGTVDGITGGIV